MEAIHSLLFEQMSSAVVVGETVRDDEGRPIDYRIVDVNPAFERLAGQKADQLVGKRASEVRPGLRQELIERLDRVAASGRPAEFEGHDAVSDRYVLIRLSRVGPTLLMAMVEDVTNARRIEAALRERNAFIETILACSGDGVVVFDRDLRYVVWNAFMEELTGLRAQEVLGRRPREFFPEVLATGIEENLRVVIDTGQPRSREFEMAIPQTGRRGWTLNTHRPHRDATGQIVGAIVSVRDVTASHEAEEALRQSEEQFRAIFDTVGDGMAIWDPHGNFLEVNRVLCERLGYTREELLAMPVRAINSPESAATIPRRARAIVRGGAVRAIEATHVRRDGTEIPIEAVSRRIEFQGKPAILSVYRDISERIRSEEAFGEQARSMQELLDALPFPIVARYTDGRPQLSNAAFAAGPGRAIEGAPGRTYGEPSETEVALHAAHDRAVHEHGAIETYEADLYFPDGTARRQFLTKAPLRSRTGEIGGTVTAGLDISDRYKTELELRLLEERFRTLFENAADGIFLVDPTSGRFIEVNSVACERLGYSREEILALSLLDVLPDENAQNYPTRVQEIVAHGSLSFEMEIKGRDGLVVPVEMRATMVDLQGHRVLLGIARDISERKAAEAERVALEEQLRWAQKMEGIGQLAGGIAHDFNNLLTVIRGSASLALADLPPGDGRRADLELIEQAADRGAGLTRQLMTFARRDVVHPEPIDLSAIVKRMEPMLRRLLREDVRLVTVTPERTGFVMADPGQIEQVVVNLVVNASDAMPEGGTLTIRTADVERAEAVAAGSEPTDGSAMTSLSVSDSGVGMDDHTLGHLFEPFFTTKDQGKGTGLGLATVYGIVRGSGGSVTVSSELGHGSTFTVYLPRVAGAAPAAAEVPSVTAKRGIRTGTILLVEDDAGVRRFASRVLEAAGYRVLTSSDGFEAMEASRNESLHLLVTDMRMPGMSGREVAARLATTQPGIRVLYMSGYADKGVVEDGMLEPNARFLAKPFTSEALLAAVGNAMARVDI